LSAPSPPYAELHCLTHFTFLRGASRPAELVQRAQQLGYSALAITDECSVAGVVRAHMAVQNGAQSLQLIIGAEFTLACGLKLVALATNRHGYARLCALITHGRRAAPKGSYHLTRADVQRHLEDCLILWLPGAVPVVEELQWLRSCFGANLWIAVELLLKGTDREYLAQLLDIGRDHAVPLVASGDVHMHARARRRLQDALTAIRHGATLAQAGARLYPNGERHLRERSRLARLYPPQLLAQTLHIAQRCTFSLGELRYEYPEELVPQGETPATWLRKLVEQGVRYRWPQGASPQARAIIERELALIAQLGYEAYFLTVHDIVAYANERGILAQGRGSAANSLVCYCLRITAIGQRLDSLLMERFISRERAEPPDIDIDFEHDRREEVIQYLYRKYGRERAALAATVIRYRGRSALHDLARVFGFTEERARALARVVQWWDATVSGVHLREAGFDPDDPLLRQIIQLSGELIGFPRHLSQHVGGFVIAASALSDLVPVENATMPERTVVQWNKDDLNDLGLLKVDVLGLGMLSALRRCLALVNDWRGTSWSLGHLPQEDPQVYAMMSNADTIGVFQIESRAQMSMLPRLKPRTFYDLVIEVALVRPGPIQGDMVHPYLRRRNGEEPIDYPGPGAQAALERTLGVPIFQEQVMQLAMHAAGFTAGEADNLRRAMGSWERQGDLHRFKDQLASGLIANHYPVEFAKRICKQIEGFGEYGFPECVVGETRVIDADTGRWRTIEEIVSSKIRLRNTLACDNHRRLRKRKVVAVVPVGVKPVWRLRTALGHTITATAEHPFMSLTGWRTLGDLRTGDYIAAARSLPVPGSKKWARHQIMVLADLIAEGNVCHPSTFYFYTTERWHCEEFVRQVEQFPNTRAVVERHRNRFSVRVRRVVRSYPCGAVLWMRSLGMWGCSARGKYLPDELFELQDSDIALFLARLWEGDGGFSMTGSASYDTASARLGSEVQHLLLRLGIVARTYRRSRHYRGRRLEHYTVTITGAILLQRFWNLIGRRFVDKNKRQRSRKLAVSRNGRMSRDIIPAEVRVIIRRERDARKLTWLEIGRRTGLGMREIYARKSPAKGGFRRAVIDRLAAALESRELSDLANSDIYWDKVVEIQECGLQPTYDLQVDGDHNFLANNLIVHNSHAASFALLVYDSAWLKHYEPAAFTCALLNSQPMGFYAPAQLVQDARRHGVEVRPVSVLHSDWDCTLEPAATEDAGAQPALRLGLRLVRSLTQQGAQRVMAARATRNFSGVADLAQRAALERRDLEALAAAAALASLSGNRHLAFWEVAGFERALPLAAADPRVSLADEGRPLLGMPTEAQNIVADMAAVGLTLGRHPVALLREQLQAEGLHCMAELTQLPHGQWARTAGLVLVRQRPGSAGGVTFMTLEDETAQLNVIVWKNIAERFRRPLVEAALLEVQGTLQREGQVLHLVARRLIDRTALTGRLNYPSRDFH